MKFLWRRIKYAFSGHLMRLFMSIFSLLAVGIFIFIMLSGSINQRELFEKIFNFTWNSSQKVADDIEDGDIPLEVNEDGVYFKQNNNENNSQNSNDKQDSNITQNNGRNNGQDDDNNQNDNNSQDYDNSQDDESKINNESE